MQVAAIYARVSSDKQKEENTIASQTAALIAFAREQGYSVPMSGCLRTKAIAALPWFGLVWSGFAILRRKDR